MAEIKIINDQGLPQEEPQAPVTPNTVIADTDLMPERVGQMFDIKPSEISKYKGKLETLIQYAKLKTDDHTPEGIKWALRSLGTKLGTPPLGEKLINYLHIYAKIYLQGKTIDEQKQKFLKGESDE